MSSFRRQDSKRDDYRQRGKRIAFAWSFSLSFCLFCSAACRQDMQDQPKYIPLRESKFFKDDLSARPLVAGTVARGWLRADVALYTGKVASAVSASSSPARSTQTAGSKPSGADTKGQTDVDVFPFPVTNDVMARGKERFQIFCAVCHGMTGEGDGMVVRRGFRRPPSYYTEELRKAPVGHFFDVVTNGWGAMPDYAQQIPVQDRWAIIAYIRALQSSQPGGMTPPPPGPPNDNPQKGSQR